MAVETKNARLEVLKKKQETLAARIAEIEAQGKAKQRKEDTRLKVIVGAACLADAAIHDETRNLLKGIVEKAVKAPRDREFLKSKGWL